MKKVHSPQKKKFNLGSHPSRTYFFKLKPRARRPKTFSSEEFAHLWAKENNINDYELKIVKKGKRFQVVEKNGKN